MPEPLSAQEVDLVASLLARLEPGFMPYSIFHQVVRIAATPIVEVVPLRLTTEGTVEVLLLKRNADDPIWPSQLHTPGTVVRGSDTPGSLADPLGRVLGGELKEADLRVEPVFVKCNVEHSGRGLEVAQIFWIEVTDATCGEFYDVHHLPETIVLSQVGFILAAAEHFGKLKNLQ